MASPFVPVPVPLDRVSSGGSSSKLRRPQRASSLGSVSSNSARGAECGGPGSQRHSRGMDRAGRSRTPPPLQSPATRARVMNGTVEASVEYSSCPRSISDPVGSQKEDEERPITPTVLGYEVMEERAKFTVFKVLVRKTPDESWVVFRRYTDFSRLNDKLKEIFPGFRLSLPPKRWFKDNYDSDFLEDRQLGLQAFLQNLVAHKDISNSLAVREFLCLDDPPGPFDSLEESRAFCETLEESNYRLQKELLEKQKEIASLKSRLQEREQAILLLQKHDNGECVSPESLCGLSAQCSDTSADPDVESSAAEADQDISDDPGGRCEVQPVRSSACWCGPTLGASPPVIQLHKWDLLERQPLLLLARRTSNGFVAEYLFPCENVQEEVKNALETIRRIYEGLINVTMGNPPLHVTPAPTLPPSKRKKQGGKLTVVSVSYIKGQPVSPTRG